MATQISPITVNQQHWLKELNDMEYEALAHLKTFEEVAGVDVEELRQATLLIVDAYAKARTAVVKR